MLRRAGITGLWFLMVAFAHEIAWSVMGSPRPLGLVLAVAVAGFVWLDPTHLRHPARQSRPRPTPAPTVRSAESSLASR
jgi:hypothetical protein